MPINKIPEALKFFDSIIQDHGADPEDVASVLAVLNNMTSMQDVSLRIDARSNGIPYTALEIHGVDTDERYKPRRMTNALGQAAKRDGVAVDYMRVLSRKIGYESTLPHGYVGSREGHAHMGSDYFVAESGLLLPRGGSIGLSITIPFAETVRSNKLPAAAN
ncbi:MAG: hypothetical protein HYT71_04015 [Candidatus Aenigmarchaeota archaeon]|nr:hypothetical protein [Candidatus Aenigmarchaeota archaeon]